MDRSEEGKEGAEVGDLLKNDLGDTDGYAREGLSDRNFERLML